MTIEKLKQAEDLLRQIGICKKQISVLRSLRQGEGIPGTILQTGILIPDFLVPEVLKYYEDGLQWMKEQFENL